MSGRIFAISSAGPHGSGGRGGCSWSPRAKSPQLPESSIFRLPESVDGAHRAAAIETVPLEDYVLGSVLAEVSPVDQPAARGRAHPRSAGRCRAHLRRRTHRPAPQRGLRPVRHDALSALRPEPHARRLALRRGRDAARRTAGLVLTYHGRLAEGLYHADCGGSTASADAVWGGPRALPHRRARRPAAERIGTWRVVVPLEQLRAALNARPATEVGRTLDRDRGDRAGLRRPRRPDLRVRGEHTHELRGEEFRTIVNRRSARAPSKAHASPCHATARTSSSQGTGFGHGVGLCQVGAADTGKARRLAPGQSSATTSRGTRSRSVKGEFDGQQVEGWAGSAAQGPRHLHPAQRLDLPNPSNLPNRLPPTYTGRPA